MTTHDATAERIARKYGTEYRRIGVDILTWQFAIEVESWADVPEAEEQLRDHIFTHKLYCAGADEIATQRALIDYQNSNIGVMDRNGNILKYASN